MENDRTITITVGASRKSTSWQPQRMLLSDLYARLKTPARSTETMAAYLALSKTEQDALKDVGGFVGGALSGPRRKADSVVSRDVITLDLDSIPAGGALAVLRNIDGMGCGYCVYSTRKHRPDAPRLRVLFPLNRPCTADEYEPCIRRMAEYVGMQLADPTTFEGHRLMYWPSVCADGEYIYYTADKPMVSVDGLLATYADWRDMRQWPVHEHAAAPARAAARQGDPLQKPNPIGAFCAVYDVHAAIAAFLPDIYKDAGDGRYTYTKGSTTGGAVVYEDGKFLYSHHATDPCSGRLVNSFDLVRLHIYGDLDDDAAPDTPVNRLPSYTAMCERAIADPAVSKRILEARGEKARDAFRALPAAEAPAPEPASSEENDWRLNLDRNKNGEVKNTLQNLVLILQNDPNLRGVVFNQLADGMEVISPVPWKRPDGFWRDADDAQLISYVEACYGPFSMRNFNVSVTKVTDDRSYHPIREMFERLPVWDGVPRVDTLLIDYLGAEDNAYVRAVTRKILCAAYLRVYRPGIKFDYCVVLSGDQGIGKSTLIAKIGMDWFSDSLTLSDMNDKTAAEKLQGYWIMEIGELAGMRKADIDKVKAFISRQDDRYRASFGRRVTPHPRQCVFFGTTNADSGYLRDVTGNRRFWNVSVSGNGAKKPWELDAETVKQMWAEVIVLATAGEKLYLTPDLEALAHVEQREAMEHDEREGLVREYLNTPIPPKETWAGLDIHQRRGYLQDANHPLRAGETALRTMVCNLEIWAECFGNEPADMHAADSYAIGAIMARIDNWERAKSRKRFPPYGLQRYYEVVEK